MKNVSRTQVYIAIFIIKMGWIMKAIAGVWIASLPRNLDGRKILDVMFVSPKKNRVRNMGSYFSICII